MQHIRRYAYFFTLMALLVSCATSKPSQPTANINSLQFLGKYEIPFNFLYNNTTTGGLSGIDYDRRTGLYYMVCDDRGDKNPPRFYEARIYFTQKGIDSVAFTGVHYLLQPTGEMYPSNKQDRYRTPDPEAIRYNPRGKHLVWSSEGERIVTAKDTVLTNPAIINIGRDGKYIDSFQLPQNLRMQLTEKGPRRNSVLEGMSYADNYKTLFVNAEEPLYEDGPPADIKENNAYIRIFKFDVNRKINTAQYAYKLEPVAHPAIPPTAFKINGVSDILSIGNNKLLVIERSFSVGRMPSTIKVFIAHTDEATDVRGIQLKGNTSFKPAPKTLVINMDDLGIYIDNIEGVTFGPDLPNGHKTLLFIADNNFNPLEKAQVLLFEVLE